MKTTPTLKDKENHDSYTRRERKSSIEIKITTHNPLHNPCIIKDI